MSGAHFLMNALSLSSIFHHDSYLVKKNSNKYAYIEETFGTTKKWCSIFYWKSYDDNQHQGPRKLKNPVDARAIKSHKNFQNLRFIAFLARESEI